VTRAGPLGLAGLAVIVSTGLPPTRADAQTPATTPAAGWRLSAVNLARVESWRYFEPRPGGGDPDYTFLGDRLRVEMRRRWPRAEVTVAAQYVGFVPLPDDAIGPGALGTGALYFDQNARRTTPQNVFLRLANVRLPEVLPGVDLQIGRMGYTSGAEAPSGVPKIESVKRQRLDARLVGEFEWAVVQRTFDGVRADVTRPAWKITGVALLPTQGGFAAPAGTTMRELLVTGATVSSRPSRPAGAATQLQGFGWYYGDRRRVTQVPDNSGRTGSRADVKIATGGAAMIGAYPAGPGEVDVLGWTVLQGGSWYGDRHAAAALAGEAGYQWVRTAWRPWLRAGVFYASGDDDPADGTHGTFFPMVPTVRRFAQTTVYGTMNLRDVFVQAIARPRPALGLRLDIHDLALASGADLWYAGSGATRSRGAVFGYAGRLAAGQRPLGTTVEGSVEWAASSRVSFAVFAAQMRGGPAVAASFAGRTLWFAYAESAVAVGAR
jgi:hypothetical protein